MSGGEAAEAAAAPPAAVLRRFPGHSAATVLDPAHRSFLALRLLEEGDGEELRWLLRTVGRDELAALVARRGGRALSRRSRAVWALARGVANAPPHPLAHELWPLA